MQCNRWPLAICSWSLRVDVEGVAAAMRRLGIDQVNLALKPAFAGDGDRYWTAIRRQAWTVSSTTIGFFQEDYTSLESIRATGGIVPDNVWPRNCEMARHAIEMTAELGVRYLSMHAGFLESDDATTAKRIRDRLVLLADAAERNGVVLLLETGQETAACLHALLEQLAHPALGVNFDPANMILYGKGDPVEAVRTLGTWIKHVHIKDAIRAKQSGRWGLEVPWGQGDVGGDAFLKALLDAGFVGSLAIEREAGDDRMRDIAAAAEWLVEAGCRLKG